MSLQGISVVPEDKHPRLVLYNPAEPGGVLPHGVLPQTYTHYTGKLVITDRQAFIAGEKQEAASVVALTLFTAVVLGYCVFKTLRQNW